MLLLKTWPTPNGQKVQILLEELGVPYRADPVNILRAEQFAPDFLAISPNNKIPALVDEDGAGPGQPVALFESGAILLYLADKYGRFIPSDPAGRAAVVQWLFFQCSNLGPMLGQVTHFRRYAQENVAYAVERYGAEATRLYGVVERRLSASEWIGGAEYGIADMACYPWLVRFRRQGMDLDAHPAIKAWISRMSERDAVKRGMDVLKDVARETPLDEQARATLFAGQGTAP